MQPRVYLLRLGSLSVRELPKSFLPRERIISLKSRRHFHDEFPQKGVRFETNGSCSSKTSPKPTKGRVASPERARLVDDKTCSRAVVEDDITPSKALERFLELRDKSSHQAYSWFNLVRNQVRPLALQSILLNHIGLTLERERFPKKISPKPTEETVNFLNLQGWSFEDVNKWAWILAGNTVEDRIARFFGFDARKPVFLFLVLIRIRGSENIKIRDLNRILTYAGTEILETSYDRTTSKFDGFNDPGKKAPSFQLGLPFRLLIVRLLSSARRFWAPATVTVTQMAAAHIQSIATEKLSGRSLDPAMHSHLCEIVNYMFGQLAKESSIAPLKSSRYNWESQKILLKLAGEFNPPLILNHDSYRSITQILLQSKKTEEEEKAAILRTDSWPPWRSDQDGMDAQRSPLEDLSRPILASIQSRESGYRAEYIDQARQIQAGMELDGTPTIQTRSLGPRGGGSNSPAALWASRIKATRDVREAWTAFREYETSGGAPHLSVYKEMFIKINADSARSGRKSTVTVPGDAIEGRPVIEDGFSSHYLLTNQPPTFDELYRQMLSERLIPQGALLAFLVARARTMNQGLQYLRDAKLGHEVVDFLSDSVELHRPPLGLRDIPDMILLAYMKMACRFATRAKSKSVLQNTVEGKAENATFIGASESEEIMNSGLTVRTLPLSTPDEMKVEKWQATKVLRSNRDRQYLEHLVFIIKQRKSNFRPIWYTMFQQLAREDALMAPELLGTPENVIESWEQLIALLDAFLNNGLELDPLGFNFICWGFEKLGLALYTSGEHKSILSRGALILQTEWAKLSEVNNGVHGLPKLFYPLDGSHCHAYIRALGAIEDHQNIFATLKWMVDNNNELYNEAHESRNGFELIKRTMISVRLFLRNTEYEQQARGLIEGVEWFEGWPTGVQVLDYISKDPRRSIDFAVMSDDSEDSVDYEEDDSEEARPQLHPKNATYKATTSGYT